MERIQQERPDSPEPSCVSMKSDHSKGGLIDLKDQHPSSGNTIQQEGPDSPEPSCVSMKSDHSKVGLKDQNHSSKKSTRDERTDPPSCVSMSDHSIGGLIDFKDQKHAFENIVHQEGSEATSEEPVQKHQTDLESTFKLLEETIVMFVKNELKNFQRVLSPDYAEDSEGQKKKEDMVDSEEEEEEKRRSSRGALLKITLNFLRRMKQEDLADCLQSRHEPQPPE